MDKKDISRWWSQSRRGPGSRSVARRSFTFPGGKKAPVAPKPANKANTGVEAATSKEGDGFCLIIQGWLVPRTLLAEGAESPLDPVEELQKLLLHLSGAAAGLEIRLPALLPEFPPCKFVFAMDMRILLVLSSS